MVIGNGGCNHLIFSCKTTRNIFAPANRVRVSGIALTLKLKTYAKKFIVWPDGSYAHGIMFCCL